MPSLPIASIAARRWPVWAIALVAAVVGFRYGYDFGLRISGVFLGVVAGLNAAALTSVLAGAGAERIARWWAARRRTR